MEKKELKEEIKKVLEGKSIYEMSPISGLNPMTKEEIIYWIVETYIDQELDKAREEGYQDCMDDIWEEAKGLRSWTEHDGSVSSADIEAGLQEAYLNIENKLRQ